jgi:alpha-amylase/alpha-mannosidase (GH57 family)
MKSLKITKIYQDIQQNGECWIPTSESLWKLFEFQALNKIIFSCFQTTPPTSSTTTTTARKSQTQKKLASRLKELRKTSLDVCPLTPRRVYN